MTLSERLAAGLLNLIVEQSLKPGEALPTVKALAKQFSVTAPTMREALRRLQATDTVELRHGSGVYVGNGVYRALMPNPNSAPMEDELVLETVAARLIIEPGIAALCALHRTEDALARMKSAVETWQHDPSQVDPLFDFHRELAAGCGNRLVYELLDSLLSLRDPEQTMHRLTASVRRRSHEEHRAIFEAVRHGDSGSAEALTRAHLKTLHDETAILLADRSVGHVVGADSN
ncbi:FadR/GntR family transcriptional regulator [Streptomyces sp. V4I23]|uniref:FadR/GntR family transcriptional regulator n=1 Tax=Streptomyces sp. V4I23 TaxID=3042282 RepID=UPI0027D7EFD0|nr:FCD domain-containing protein [Streptomyces sp. V4I23]